LLNRLADIRSRKNDGVLAEGAPAARLALAAGDAEAEYAAAFREYGVDVLALPAAEAAARLGRRPPAVVTAVAAALDDWARERKSRKLQAPWRQPLEVALRVDPDPLRRRLRRAWAAGDLAALRRVAAGKPDGLPAATVAMLGAALRHGGDVEAALRWLEPAQRRDPGDVWFNYELAECLRLASPPRVEEALRYYTAARALRPELGYTLAALLRQQGKKREALALFREVVRLRPDNAWYHNGLGAALAASGDRKGSLAAFETALRLKPDFHQAHNNRGIELMERGDLKGAIAAFKEALRIEKDYPEAHTNLSAALLRSGDTEGAIAHAREAIRLKPGSPIPHLNLGGALERKGDWDGAIACYLEARRLRENHPDAHIGLGICLTQKGDVEGALAAFKLALRIDPTAPRAHLGVGAVLKKRGDVNGAAAAFAKARSLAPGFFEAHYNLGIALRMKGDVQGAIASFKEAVRLDKGAPMAHCNLGLTLRRAGRFDEALASLKRGHALGTRQPGWPHPSDLWIRRCQRLLELDRRLPTALRGEAELSGRERLEFAQLCLFKGRYLASARFAREAFAADKETAAEPRMGFYFDAACAAALAGCGRSEDARKLNPEERARWRSQALEWIRAGLRLLAEQLDRATPAGRAEAVEVLGEWQCYLDLACVREAKALGQLPAAERPQWEKFWADLGKVLERARAAD
jgi:tetratricopeptide (TPR) repeat protein